MNRCHTEEKERPVCTEVSDLTGFFKNLSKTEGYPQHRGHIKRSENSK